jgi:hypothetical protein
MKRLTFLLSLINADRCTAKTMVDLVLILSCCSKCYLSDICLAFASPRRLIEEIKVNIAYRWFVGLSLTDPVPHHSTFSQNRRRRFGQSDVYQEIFDEIVLQAIQHGLIDGKQLFSDSTFLKANASKSKFKKQKVTVTPKDYMVELEKAIDEDRIQHGKDPLKKTSKIGEKGNPDQYNRSGQLVHGS